MQRRLAAWVLAGVLALVPARARGHSGPGVLVDTDMAADDARALALLLNCPYVNVLAVVTSDGVSPPDVGATYVCRMLGFLKLDGVAVGMGRSLGVPAPALRTSATGLDWAQLGEPVVPVGGILDAALLIRLAAESSPSNLVFVCLGPLTNLKDALEQRPELAKMIGRVLWYGTSPNAARATWNATRDEAALKKIAAAGLTLEAIHWPEEAAAPVLDRDTALAPADFVSRFRSLRVFLEHAKPRLLAGEMPLAEVTEMAEEVEAIVTLFRDLQGHLEKPLASPPPSSSPPAP